MDLQLEILNIVSPLAVRDGAEVFEVTAQQLAKSHDIPITEAYALLAEARPDLYRNYRVDGSRRSPSSSYGNGGVL